LRQIYDRRDGIAFTTKGVDNRFHVGAVSDTAGVRRADVAALRRQNAQLLQTKLGNARFCFLLVVGLRRACVIDAIQANLLDSRSRKSEKDQKEIQIKCSP
jgi:hypothetical protein